ncbi:MAG: SGNH/GDSL hydrolase family protein [Methylocystis sp.]
MSILWVFACFAALLASAGAAFALAFRGSRDEILLALARKPLGFAPRIVVVGDSLAACCPFQRLSRRPLGVLRLARGGATLTEIAGQLARVQEIGARYVIIDGGLNDILFHEAPIDRVERDFDALLSRLGEGRKAIFTLMPYVSDPARGERIATANGRMAALCAARGVAVLDLNPELSKDGARRPEMTDDGLHFSPRANDIWIAAVRRMIG